MVSPFKRHEVNLPETVEKETLTEKKKKEIALEYLSSPLELRLTRKERKKGDHVWVLTKEMNLVKLDYKQYPKGFNFRGKYYPIIPKGIVPLKTKWRKRLSGARMYIQVEDTLGPVHYNGSEILTDIPWFDEKSGEIVKEQIVVTTIDDKGKEETKTLVRPKMHTSREIFDELQAAINETYLQKVYGYMKSRQGQVIIVLVAMLMVTLTLSIVFGALAYKAGAL